MLKAQTLSSIETIQTYRAGVVDSETLWFAGPFSLSLLVTGEGIRTYVFMFADAAQ